MASVFNTNRERAIVHTIGTGKTAQHIVIKPNKLTEVPDDVLTLIRASLTEAQNAELIVGDADIAKARSSAQALVNQAEAKAAAALAENADLKAQLAAQEKLLLELKAANPAKR